MSKLRAKQLINALDALSINDSNELYEDLWFTLHECLGTDHQDLGRCPPRDDAISECREKLGQIASNQIKIRPSQLNDLDSLLRHDERPSQSGSKPQPTGSTGGAGSPAHNAQAAGAKPSSSRTVKLEICDPAPWNFKNVTTAEVDSDEGLWSPSAAQIESPVSTADSWLHDPSRPLNKRTSEPRPWGSTPETQTRGPRDSSSTADPWALPTPSSSSSSSSQMQQDSGFYSEYFWGAPPPHDTTQALSPQPQQKPKHPPQNRPLNPQENGRHPSHPPQRNTQQQSAQHPQHMAPPPHLYPPSHPQSQSQSQPQSQPPRHPQPPQPHYAHPSYQNSQSGHAGPPQPYRQQQARPPPSLYTQHHQLPTGPFHPFMGESSFAQQYSSEPSQYNAQSQQHGKPPQSQHTSRLLSVSDLLNPPTADDPVWEYQDPSTSQSNWSSSSGPPMPQQPLPPKNPDSLPQQVAHPQPHHQPPYNTRPQQHQQPKYHPHNPHQPPHPQAPQQVPRYAPLPPAQGQPQAQRQGQPQNQAQGPRHYSPEASGGHVAFPSHPPHPGPEGNRQASSPGPLGTPAAPAGILDHDKIDQLYTKVESMADPLRNETLGQDSLQHPFEAGAVQDTFAKGLPRVRCNDARSTVGAGEPCPTHFTCRPIDVYRKIMDELAAGLRWLLAGALLTDRHGGLHFEKGMIFKTTSSTEPLYLSIPRTDLNKKSIVLDSPVLVLSKEHGVSLEVLVSHYAVLFKSRCPDRVESATRLRLLFKGLVHRSLLSNDSLTGALWNDSTLETLQAEINRVLDPAVLDRSKGRDTEGPITLNHVAEAVKLSRRGCRQLIALARSLRDMTEDTVEAALGKLRLLQRSLACTDPTSERGETCRNFVAIALGSRFALGDHVGKPVTDPADDHLFDRDESGYVCASGAIDEDKTIKTRVSQLLFDGTTVSSNEYVLPDSFSVSNIDVIMRAFDNFAVAMAEILNDQQGFFWTNSWGDYRIYDSTSGARFGELFVPYVDPRKTTKRSVREILREKPGCLPHPCYDPLVILDYVSRTADLFTQEICRKATDLKDVRMSLCHQTSIVKAVPRSAVFLIVNDLASVVERVAVLARTNSQKGVLACPPVTQCNSFLHCVQRGYLHFTNRRFQSSRTLPPDGSLKGIIDCLIRYLEHSPESLVSRLTRALTRFAPDAIALRNLRELPTSALFNTGSEPEASAAAAVAAAAAAATEEEERYFSKNPFAALSAGDEDGQTASASAKAKGQVPQVGGETPNQGKKIVPREQPSQPSQSSQGQTKKIKGNPLQKVLSAIQEGSVSQLRKIANFGASFTEDDQKTIFAEAVRCCKSDLSVVRAVRDLDLVEFNTVYGQGYRKDCGMAEMCGGNVHVFRYLLDGLRIRAMQNHSQTSVLHIAAKNGFMDLVQYLVEEVEFDVNVWDEDRNLPLHLAAAAGKPDVVKYLIAQGSKVGVYNYKLLLPEDASESNAVRQLFHAKYQEMPNYHDHPKCNCNEDFPHVILAMMVPSGRLDCIVFQAAKRGVSLTEPYPLTSRDGVPLGAVPPIHWAVYFGQIDIVKFFCHGLWDQEALGEQNMVFLKDDRGRTPLRFLQDMLEHGFARPDARAERVVRFLSELQETLMSLESPFCSRD